MWVLTAPLDAPLPSTLVNHGDDFAKSKVMKCGETYTFGRNNHGNDFEIHHKTVSKNVGSFIVGGWTADDVVDPKSVPTLELVSQTTKKIKVDVPFKGGFEVEPNERVVLEDGCEVWVTQKISITVRWKPVVCYETTGKVKAPISLEGCASLGIHVLKTHHPAITHHLVPSYALTPINAASLVIAAQLVKPSWLTELLRLGSLPRDDPTSLEAYCNFPPESDYRPGFATGLRDALRDMQTWSPNKDRIDLFRDRRFIFMTTGPSKGPPADYVQVVERGAGTYEACAASGGVARVKKVFMKGIAWANERSGALSLVADVDALETELGADKWEDLVQAAADLDLKFILPENILQAVVYVDPFYVDSAAHGTGSALPDVVQNTHPNEPTYADTRTPAKRAIEIEDDDEEMPPPKKPARRTTRAASREPSQPPEPATPAPSTMTDTAQTAPTPRRPPRRATRKVNVGFDDDDDSIVVEPPPRATRSRAGSEQPTGPSATQGTLTRPRSRRQNSANRILSAFDEDEDETPASKAATQLSRYRGLFEESEGASQANGQPGGVQSNGFGGLGAVPEEEEESTASFLERQGGGIELGGGSSGKRKADAMELDDEELREIADDPEADLPESQTQVYGSGTTTQSQRKRRAVEGLNAIEPSGATMSQTQVQPAGTQAPKSQTQTYTKPPSKTDGTQAKPKSSAGEHKPDTDAQFLKALNSTKKGKKKEDEFDRDFNKLRISKPEPAASGSSRKEEWDVLADFGDDSVRGNFMVVVDFDVDMVPRRAGKTVQEDPRWIGRQDFKKFVKKGESSSTRRRTKAVELVISEEQDYGADLFPQKQASLGDVTLDTSSNNTPEPPRPRSKAQPRSQGRTRNRFASAASDQDSDSPPPVRKPSSRTQTQTTTQRSSRSKAKEKTPLFDIGSEEEAEMAMDPDADQDEEDEVSTLREPSVPPPAARGAKRKAVAAVPVDDDDSDEATFKGFGKGKGRKRGRFG